MASENTAIAQEADGAAAAVRTQISESDQQQSGTEGREDTLAVRRRQFWGYGFFAPGVYGDSSRPDWVGHVGVGVEWRFHGPFAIAPELGVFVSNEEYAGPMLSLNATYLMRDQTTTSRSFAPFVTAGYSRGPGFNLLLGSSFLNLGAGANYWFGRGGVRFEVRHHERVAGDCGPPSPDCRRWLLDFRIGLLFGR